MPVQITYNDVLKRENFREVPKNMIGASKIVLLTCIVILLPCLFEEALACSCRMPRQPCQAYWEAGAVFVGRVKAKEIIKNGSVRVTFTITEALRGVAGTETDVFTSDSSASCGFNFIENKLYIVYAGEFSQERGKLRTNSCTRTQIYNDSSPDILYARSVNNLAPGSVIFGTITHRRKGNGPGTSVPLSNIRVLLTGKEKQRVAVTDSEGRFSMSDLPAGEYTVKPELPEGMVGGPEKKISVVDRGCAEVFVQTRWDGRLSGTVYDADGHVVKGVNISLVDAETGHDAQLSYHYSDDKGHYEVGMIQPGRYQILLQYFGLIGSKPGTLPHDAGVSVLAQPVFISIGEGQKIRDFPLHLPPLPPRRLIEGEVLFTDGKSLSGAHVAYEQDLNQAEKIKIDEQARFSFRAYQGGKYSIKVIVQKENGEMTYISELAVPKETEKAALKIKITIDPLRGSSTVIMN